MVNGLTAACLDDKIVVTRGTKLEFLTELQTVFEKLKKVGSHASCGNAKVCESESG